MTIRFIQRRMSRARVVMVYSYRLFVPTVYQALAVMTTRFSVAALAAAALASLLLLPGLSSGQCVTCSPSQCERADGGDDNAARSATFPIARSHGMPGKQGPKVGGRGRFSCLTTSPRAPSCLAFLQCCLIAYLI